MGSTYFYGNVISVNKLQNRVDSDNDGYFYVKVGGGGGVEKHLYGFVSEAAD